MSLSASTIVLLALVVSLADALDGLTGFGFALVGTTALATAIATASLAAAIRAVARVAVGKRLRSGVSNGGDRWRACQSALLTDLHLLLVLFSVVFL